MKTIKIILLITVFAYVQKGYSQQVNSDFSAYNTSEINDNEPEVTSAKKAETIQISIKWLESQSSLYVSKRAPERWEDSLYIPTHRKRDQVEQNLSQVSTKWSINSSTSFYSKRNPDRWEDSLLISAQQSKVVVRQKIDNPMSAVIVIK